MGDNDLDWMSFGVSLLWLGAAALFARSNRPDEPGQLRRIPLTAFAFVAGTASVFLLMGTITGDLGEILPWVAAGGLILGLAAFLSTLIVDLGATMLDATRTPPWLAGGVIMAILVTYCWLAMLARALGATSFWVLERSPVFFTPALIAAATGLVWWSELPRPEGEPER